MGFAPERALELHTRGDIGNYEEERRQGNMAERHVPVVEKILHRIESHIEEWRKEEVARQIEVEANRERLWAEAIERERLLLEETAGEGEQQQAPAEVAEKHRVVFVVHSEEMAATLQAFARERVRLVEVVSGGGDFGTSRGVRGSWLIFEPAE
jgi:hypothetical protein